MRCASFTAPHRTCTVYRQTHTLYSCPMTIRCEAINWCLNSLAYFEWIEFISVTDRRTAYIFHSSTLLSIGPNGNFFIENTACSDSAWFASLRYNLCRRHNGTLHKLEWLLFCLLAAKKNRVCSRVIARGSPTFAHLPLSPAPATQNLRFASKTLKHAPSSTSTCYIFFPSFFVLFCFLFLFVCSV